MGLLTLVSVRCSCACALISYFGLTFKALLFTMLVFKDIITGDEMFTDSYKYVEENDAFYKVIGKNITVKSDDIQLEGSNPSAEDGGDDFGAGGESISGIDVCIHMRLAETSFGAKKEYIVYLKDYLKALKEKLTEEGETEALAKLPNIQKPVAEILKGFKDLQFFTGESGNPDGMIAILDYQDIDGEERPVVFFPKYGIKMEKF